MATHFEADRSAVLGHPFSDEASHAAVLFGPTSVRPSEFQWAEAQTQLRFSNGEVRFLLLGSRRGRRRYLSEDLEEMRRLAGVIVEQVEGVRSEELKRLAVQAELRALQAQINPHFLFNALNTLYGSIDRSSHQARRMVLNLSEIFRYFLQDDRTFITFSEELRIVQAYLDIEGLRLGDRLETRLDVSEPATAVMIPSLLVQPLVENAVKHGVAARPGQGRVTLRAYVHEGLLTVTIEDTGAGRSAENEDTRKGAGVGLRNVRRRLELAYGPKAKLEFSSTDHGTCVSVQIPVVPSPDMAIAERGLEVEPAY